MKKRLILVLGVVLVLFGAWFMFSGKKAVAGRPPTQEVATSGGQLRGFGQDGLNVYLGIPYAEAPAGKLRFKAPVVRKP
ncbi:MAG: carboxylesterase family protein, partial [Chloroflexota bacterium]